MARYTNPLDQIKVASPCPADWEQMYGNDQVRFCQQCKLNVYNLSAMTKAEAEKLIMQTEGRLCGRYYRRADGTILTADCPVGWQAIKRRVARVAGAVLSAMLSFFAGSAFSAYLSKPEKLNSLPMEVGKIALPLPQDQKTVPPPEPENNYVVGRISADSIKNVKEQCVKGKTISLPVIQPTETNTIKMSEGLMRGRLINQVRPEIPAILRTANFKSTVVLAVVVDEQGKVASATAISGHPLVQKAVLDAVKQWTFEPTLLNGAPVKVQTNITIQFSL